jgi:hypothetical protein
MDRRNDGSRKHISINRWHSNFEDLEYDSDITKELLEDDDGSVHCGVWHGDNEAGSQIA